ncbi:acyl-CoA dehydrogenase NM domain-like protein [Multifurca ochricompacta]|uniref:Acyl-CoA dehydrogenase NM domain-like protein n=1 Tax=Multifurca ochricompacta TaxID=376703 RepID=A0AAD4LWF1_9AGAM|nr:acyl-CoA dehydrogenase NM domain-like protein [Multifurca ochricompacta]
MRPTVELAQSTLFTQRCEALSISDRIKLSYERARAIGRAYALTVKDVLFLSPKFWEMHTDPIACIDGAAETLVTIQYNLCAGTLATYLQVQPSLAPVLQRVLNFEVSGQFCLTELGHGLDVIHMETTATLLPDGDFDLHTPLERAAKYMPPTSPVAAGLACVAVVFARTVVNGEDHGVKPFVLQLHDGQSMTPGVTTKDLPPRGGSRPLNHSLTYFNHVRLPSTALLGSIKKPRDPRASFFEKIQRVAVGTLALSALCIPSLQVASYVAARYSLRRTIVDASGTSKPIISFQTQKQPILTAVAQSFVFKAMYKQAIAWFTNPTLDPRVRHAVATVHKAAVVQASQIANLALGDRCGAQGLFEANQLSAVHSDIRGVAIAEGDLLGISIRLASELLLGRYALEPPRYPDSLLAQHERGLFSELRAILAAAPSHRSSTYDRDVLPRSLPLIQAIGHRIAYDAARAAQVDPPLLDLFEAASVLLDEAWYVENLGVSRAELREREARAIEAAFPHLEEYLSRMDVAPYVVAPIVSDEKWGQFLGTLHQKEEEIASVSAISDLGRPSVAAFLNKDDHSLNERATTLQIAPRGDIAVNV